MSERPPRASSIRLAPWRNVWQTIFIATLLLVRVSSAPAAEDELADVREQMRALRETVAAQDAKLTTQAREIEQLKAREEEDWLNTRRTEEVKALIAEVLADADTRASLYGDMPVAGWNNGFFLRSADGNYMLQILGMIQARYVFSRSPDARDESKDPPADLDDDRGGFDLSRIRLGFKGHVIDPSWQYFIWTGYQWTGDTILLDAYIRKDLGGGLSVTAGQFKTPLLYEWLVSETRQQFIERSLISGCFCGTYMQGLLLTYRNDDVMLLLSLNDGLKSLNGAWNVEDVEGFGVTGRAAWRVTGDWKQYDDFESWPDEDPLLVFGAAGHYEQGEYGTSGTTLTTGDEAQTVRWTLDSSLELGGVNLYAAFIANHLREADVVPDMDQYTALVQGGWFVTRDLELVGRYEWGDFGLSGVEDLSLLTLGFNRFFAGHAVKLMMDAGYSFNALNRLSIAGNTFGWPVEFAGWRPDAAGESGQIVVRVQMQLLF